MEATIVPRVLGQGDLVATFINPRSQWKTPVIPVTSLLAQSP